ncbi:MAG: hypothetical protein FWD22_07340 [Treponema sp.]|nr:hypothetical protein [Treponema sp.]
MNKLFLNTRILFIVCLFLTPVLLFAQADEAAFAVAPANSPAAEFEVLLNTGVVTYAQAARFVLEASEAFVTNNPNEAFDFAMQNGWLPGKVTPDDNAQLNHISRLLMRSFNLKGGIFYSITKSSRYAYRELVYKNVIQGRADATMPVSGERLIFYVNRLLTQQSAAASSNLRRI